MPGLWVDLAMTIIEAPVPHKNRRPPVTSPDCLVLHDTGGKTAEGALAWFRDPASQVSSHYLIDKDGTIYRCVPEEERAWHAGHSELFGRPDVNSFSLGIELVDDSDVDAYPAAQLGTLIDLLVDLCRRYRIPLNRVVGHQHIAPGRKGDPGPDFPWGSVLAQVGARLVAEGGVP